MKGLLIAFGLIACAAALPAQDYLVEIGPNGERICRENCGRRFNWECPSIPCPGRPVPPITRDCTIPSCLTNDAWWLLWPHPENEFQFLQCRGMGVWAPIERDCSCGTLFDYQEQRCVHPHEYSPQCNRHPVTPRPLPCPVCDNDCDGPVNPENPVTQTTTTTTQASGNGGSCPCVCVPCVAWPCNPCPTSCCRSAGFNEEQPLLE